MSSIIWKHFYLCFSNLKCAPTTCSTLPPPSPANQEDSHNINSPPIQTLVNNFNSLYDSTTTSKSLSSSTNDFFFSSPENSENTADDSSPPDLTTVFASQRFFFSSPGRSKSIFESPENLPESSNTLAASGGVAIRTYSPDPYSDFRRSMQEMVEARDLTDAEANWDFLHELLLCYLSLNPKHTHKFIVSAFSDLLISLMPSTSRRKMDQGHHFSRLF